MNARTEELSTHSVAHPRYERPREKLSTLSALHPPPYSPKRKHVSLNPNEPYKQNL
ncbi:hypothetical protein [Oceanobacillus luteolus]|uniref:Uncharacterized protein n=1 Tax=Oceanobacillus luteolus TaxID=1274358 RepID=A0ABW4HYT0_9BACI